MNHFKSIILAVVCKHKDQQRILSVISQETSLDSSSILEAAFPSIYAQYLPCLAEGERANSEARSQYNLFTSTIGLDRVKNLALLKIDNILIELTKLVWDPHRHEEILRLDPTSTPPSLPCISYDEYAASLRYLQVMNIFG